MFPVLLALFPLCIPQRSRRRPAPLPPKAPLADVLIVLDPGHGGEDSGAIRGGMHEDQLNYRLAAEISQELQKRGADVWFTVSSKALSITGVTPFVAPTDACLTFNKAPLKHRRQSSAQELWQRAALVRSAVKTPNKSVFFLSLHADSLESRKWWGARVYRDTRDKGECRFARQLLARLSKAGLTYRPNGRIVPRDYGVLNPAYNPAPQKALVEAFTISSPQDRARAHSVVWRKKVVNAVVESVLGSLPPIP
ncbi:MAG: N-acetylmuramoyl-L-alanine amidase [Armatimonas sp.]